MTLRPRLSMRRWRRRGGGLGDAEGVCGGRTELKLQHYHFKFCYVMDSWLRLYLLG